MELNCTSFVVLRFWFGTIDTLLILYVWPVGILTLLKFTLSVVDTAWLLYDNVPVSDDINGTPAIVGSPDGRFNVYDVAVLGITIEATPTPAPVKMCVGACSDSPVIFPDEVINRN